MTAAGGFGVVAGQAVDVFAEAHSCFVRAGSLVGKLGAAGELEVVVAEKDSLDAIVAS